MLLNGGELDGVRLLGPKTVELMSTDHLGDVPGPGRGIGFGLGFAVKEIAALSGTPSSVGEYNWGGLHGTSFWIDPERELAIVLLSNRVHPSRENERIKEFRPFIHDQIVELQEG